MQDGTHPIFKTKPLTEDGSFSIAWQQFLQSVYATQQNSAKAYTLTHAQRLALHTSNLATGSIVFEIDTSHVFIWNGKSFQQLV